MSRTTERVSPRPHTAPAGLSLAPVLLSVLAGCVPGRARIELATALPPAPAIVTPAMIVDPPTLPGTPVAFVRDAEPRPVVYYPQPERISPLGEPLVLPPPIPHGDRQIVFVQAVPTSLGFFAGATDGRRLVSVLNRVGRGRFDALHLEVRGSGWAVWAIVRAAVRAGVDPLKIVTVAANGPPEVIATRYVASAPVCPSLAVVGPSVIDNDFEPTLGCSTRQNLAAIVNDPADLLGNGAAVPADGARAAVGIEAYRTGTSAQVSAVSTDTGGDNIGSGSAASTGGTAPVGPSRNRSR